MFAIFMKISMSNKLLRKNNMVRLCINCPRHTYLKHHHEHIKTKLSSSLLQTLNRHQRRYLTKNKTKREIKHGARS